MIRVADEIWIATALLQIEHPERGDFSTAEIVQRALTENLAGRYRSGLMAHASNHCVATKPPNPARLRMLHATARGRRRLFRPSDPCHPKRRTGKMQPDRSDLPPTHQHLIDWYGNVYVREPGDGAEVHPPPRGGAAEDLLRLAGTPSTVLLEFMGSIPESDLRLMEKVIEEDCERIDPDAW